MQGRPLTQGNDFMTDASVTIHGNLTADPVTRVLPSGISVANFTVAHTPRRRVAGTENEWEDDGDTLFLRVAVWRQLADNAAASLRKGHAVAVTGRLSVRHWTTDSGEPRTDVICDADTVAVDLRRATAVVTRNASTPVAGEPGEPWAAPAVAAA